MAQPEDEKVKVVYFNDPKKFRFVTKPAASLLSPKWVIAEDQTGAPNPNGQKKAVAAPAENITDRKADLRAKYNELTGELADPEWNEARLFTAIRVAEVNAEKAAKEKLAATAEEETVAVTEAVAAPTTKKRGPKKKTEAAEV